MAGGRTLRWRAFRLPMRHRFEAAHGTLADREGVLIELADGDGQRGYGEAAPLPSFGGGAVADVLALLDRHAAAIVEHEASEEDEHAPGVAALRCALDVASLDLEARRAGVTVAALLAGSGGAVPAEGVAVNAVIGDGPPADVARFGAEAVARGYRVLKVKVGVAPVAEDVLRIGALRAACPDAAIRLDANGAWDEATAMGIVDALAALDIELIEQPVAAGDVEALARVRERASMPIAADEAMLDPATRARVLETRAADLVVLKPMLLGGLRPAFAVARDAAARGLGAIVTTTFDSSVGTAASLHLAAALAGIAVDGAPRRALAHGLGTGEHLAADVVAETLVARDGWMALPEGAGLGVVPDEDALASVSADDWSTYRR
ncbi:MAG: o-succinylbenzoate synthase [Dehalococcoidia bacterium]